MKNRFGLAWLMMAHISRFQGKLGYPILLMSIAALVRLVPTVLAWPYPLGFDTNASYLPWMTLGVPNSLIMLIKDALLSQIFMNFIYSFYPHPFEILNAFAIILQSALAFSVYVYARKVTKLSNSFSFVAGVAFTLSILTFRLTWDQYRMSFALIFVILTWVLLSSERHKKAKYIAIPVAVLVVLSNPLPAAIFIGSMITYLILKRSEIKRMLPELSTTIVTSVLFLTQLLLVFTNSNKAGVPLEAFGTFGGITASLSGLSYLFFASWPLLVLLPLAILKIKNEYHWIGLFWILAIALVGPLVGVTIFSLWSYWLISFPLAILFGLTLERYVSRRIVRYSGVLLILASVIMMMFWVTSTPESANPYFSTLSRDNTPIGYLQTTVDLPYQSQLMTLLKESITSVPRDSAIYLPAQFYGLALMIPNRNQVNLINMGEIAPRFFNTSFSQIDTYMGSYSLWLTKPNGWYGVSSMPSNFLISINGGEFSLYYISSI